MTAKVFIDGEHGTTGLQIRARLAARRDLQILSLPEAERRNDALRAERLHEADVAILCLPDDGAREAVAMLEETDSTRVIDTSTAHRTALDWIYGFAELEPGQEARIADARLVSNPGCYSTGAIALIRPLVAAGLLPDDYPVSINAVSGYTGGGKQLVARMEDAGHPEHIAEAHFLYGLSLEHKHVAEVQARGLLARRPLFSPSVGRFAQGMLVQVPLHLDRLAGSADVAAVHSALADHYAGREQVQVAPLAESAGLVRLFPTELVGTDTMKLHVFGAEATGHINLVAVLDNLGKGASGAAVQNMDLMLGNTAAA